MIIVISTQYVEHNKVPQQEQLVAAGCCAHAMQMAAYALGYGAMCVLATLLTMTV